MHYLVKMLVKADTAEEALQQAESDADSMVEYQHIDWYDMNGGWGKSEAYPIISKEGKKLLKKGMECSRDEFNRAMEAIRYMMDTYSDDDIYNEEFTKTDQREGKYYLSRYQFTVAAGRENAAAVYAMDDELWGGRVNNDKDLKRILGGQSNEKLWVVPVDVHN